MNKKSLKRLATMLLVAIMVVASFTGCGKKNGADTDTKNTNTPAPTNGEDKKGEDTPATTEAPTPTEEPVMDLGGMEIVIADWWSGTTWVEDEAKAIADGTLTAQQEARYDYLHEIQEKYNFTIVKKQFAGWGDSYKENYSMSVISEQPEAQVWMMQSDWVVSLVNQGLCYDWSKLTNIDLSEDKWNEAVTESMSKGAAIYGTSWGKFEPRAGVFFNKRLLKEAGIDENLPYDLQKSGEWTWAKFEELLDKLTYDKDGDGVNDAFGMYSGSMYLFPTAVLSNEAAFVRQDENGNYYNATNEPAFLEAVQWVCSLIEKGYEMPSPPDSEWDYFNAAFPDGKAAFQVYQDYKAGTFKDVMEDDYGFVLFPRGPKASTYHTNIFENVAVIPSCYDAETADKIAFALNLWANPTPGYEDDWMTGYYEKYRDTRAVEETLATFYEPDVCVTELHTKVPGLDLGPLFFWDLYSLAKTPAELIEANQAPMQVYLDEVNKK